MNSESSTAARMPGMWSRLAASGVAFVFCACLFLPGCADGTRVGHGAPTPPVKSEIQVYTSPAELLAGMSEDAYPRAGAGGARDLKAADEWVARNRAGQRIEWTATVRAVSVGEGDRIVCLSLEGEEPTSPAGVGGWPWGEPVPLAGEKCQVRITRVACGPVGPATAKKVGEWQGKKATLRALLTSVSFGPDTGAPLSCRLEVALQAIDGYVPAVQKQSMSPKG
jgi:hypothetical protein